jgi:SSS family transporter
MEPIDLAVILVYVSGCTVLGAWLGRKVQGTSAYFLGERNIPAWAVMLSIVATETSTATFLSVPALAFRPGGNFTFLQLALGFVVGRVFVSLLLLPAYFQGQILTAYEVLDRRFGGATKRVASGLFLVTRTLADGLRLMLASLVLKEMTGWNTAGAIAVMGVVTIVYTYLGGMRAVVWTDVIQFVIYIAGAIIALLFLLGKLPEGWNTLAAAGEAAGKFRVLDFTFDVTKPFTFWSGLVGGVFLSTATHGADQMMVQRYLAARSQRAAATALVTSGFVVLAQFALFLTIGVGLFAFFQGTTRAEIKPDQAFASFIVNDLPRNAGLIGLLVAAIFSASMSTLSSSLNASAAASLNDFIRPLIPRASDRLLLRLSKVLTAFWGGAQVGVALGAIGMTATVVDAVIGIASFTTGIVLGLFLLGQLTRRVGQGAALTGLVAGLLVVSYVAFGASLPTALYPWKASVAWPWYALIGSTTVFLVGLLTSYLRPEISLAAADTTAAQTERVS